MRIQIQSAFVQMQCVRCDHKNGVHRLIQESLPGTKEVSAAFTDGEWKESEGKKGKETFQHFNASTWSTRTFTFNMEHSSAWEHESKSTATWFE